MTDQQTPKTGKDFVRLAKKSDKVTDVREGKGSHVIVEFTDETSISVPVHGSKQLGRGILHKITKAFKAAGVIGLVFFALWLFARMLSF